MNYLYSIIDSNLKISQKITHFRLWQNEGKVLDAELINYTLERDPTFFTKPYRYYDVFSSDNHYSHSGLSLLSIIMCSLFHKGKANKKLYIKRVNALLDSNLEMIYDSTSMAIWLSEVASAGNKELMIRMIDLIPMEKRGRKDGSSYGNQTRFGDSLSYMKMLIKKGYNLELANIENTGWFYNYIKLGQKLTRKKVESFFNLSFYRQENQDKKYLWVLDYLIASSMLNKLISIDLLSRLIYLKNDTKNEEIKERLNYIIKYKLNKLKLPINLDYSQLNVDDWNLFKNGFDQMPIQKEQVQFLKENYLNKNKIERLNLSDLVTLNQAFKGSKFILDVYKLIIFNNKDSVIRTLKKFQKEALDMHSLDFLEIIHNSTKDDFLTFRERYYEKFSRNNYSGTNVPYVNKNTKNLREIIDYMNLTNCNMRLGTDLYVDGKFNALNTIINNIKIKVVSDTMVDAKELFIEFGIGASYLIDKMKERAHYLYCVKEKKSSLVVFTEKDGILDIKGDMFQEITFKKIKDLYDI
jgi:hypothetical protein